jgi:hypothetical protein
MSARRRAFLLVQDQPEIVDLLAQILNQRSTVYLNLTPSLRPMKDSFSGVGACSTTICWVCAAPTPYNSVMNTEVRYCSGPCS